MLFQQIPDIRAEVEKTLTSLDKEAINIVVPLFWDNRDRICFVDGLWYQLQSMEEEMRDRLIRIALKPDLETAKHDLRAAACKGHGGWFKWTCQKVMSMAGLSEIDSAIRGAEGIPFYGDAEFVAHLDSILARLPLLRDLVTETKVVVADHLKTFLSNKCNQLTKHVMHIHQTQVGTIVEQMTRNRLEEEKRKIRVEFVHALNRHSRPRLAS